MVQFHVYGDRPAREAIRDLLIKERYAAPEQIRLMDVNRAHTDSAQLGANSGVSVEDDIFIVAGDDLLVGELIRRGVSKLFDGTLLLQRDRPANRFLHGASHAYIGPNRLTIGKVIDEATRFPCEPLELGNIPRDRLFIVNSMPKSGTVWMTAMIETMLDIRAKEQISIAHVGDLEDHWNRPNNHGAVCLVRDMRDVVVSWFHHSCRTDIQLGYGAPRYPTIETFYRDYFVGAVRATRRFYFGDLSRWLDIVSANYIPIVRYEDLRRDTADCLRKVTTFWRVTVPDETLQTIVRQYAFDTMAATVGSGRGFVSEMVANGHLRRGRVGCWREELPQTIAQEIQVRFAEYQERLDYGAT